MKITIQANSGDFSFECEASQRILYAGLGQGVRLPYECATGTCGTCRGRVVAGSALVEWDEAPGYAKLKRAKGDVLMCQARPTGDCILRVPANLAPADPLRPTLPRHRQGRIARVERLVRDVLEIDIALSQPITFDAGQFVVFEVPGVRGGRAYSMVNFCRDSERLTFVVKQKPGGRLSDWLFGNDVTGAELDLFGPLGAATFRPAEGRNILCIAGGSGIAGMLAILEHARREDYFREHHGHVFFGVRGLADGFYLRELADHVAAAAGKLRVTLALSHAPAPSHAHPQWPNIGLATGMVTDVVSREMAGRYDGTVSFIAGPPPMVDEALRLLIRVARQPAAFVRYDKYT
jgi:toluene monooxygenase electron transfer component